MEDKVMPEAEAPRAEIKSWNTSGLGGMGEKGEEPRFQIKKWSAIALWGWDICTDTCAICRNKLYEPSIEAQANPQLADVNGYSIAFGCCGHVFHMDCISRWLKTRSVCPLCNQEWEFAKVEKIAAFNPIG
ncbi:Roc1a [Symbiodinium necroappetens]|uniref:Roc1a protein n=1 Tax=Symbiodinium necroappetens TaxID=1628268 RepID=A0A813AN22_9DINO|nr:Roc1a [Symbiodinium necroappetens]